MKLMMNMLESFETAHSDMGNRQKIKNYSKD